ncbi:energy transducer TonB [Granulicella arctica]|uniref:energy transducer TonB n=1 Tax=Granulicella arctica TaxID=940613 RepID=UPI0021E0BB6E|nr:energy transducer TonB [Granulicella arctica]
MRSLQNVALIALVLIAVRAEAQQPACGLTSMRESVAPFFPSIAKAAHVQGTVVLLVNFTRSGEADSVTVVAGPEMLRESALEFVRGWRANSFSGVRTCPIAIDYRLQQEGDKQVPRFQRQDLQHGTLNSGVPIAIP